MFSHDQQWVSIVLSIQIFPVSTAMNNIVTSTMLNSIVSTAMNNIVTSTMLNSIVETMVNNIVETMLNSIVKTMVNGIVETTLNSIVGPTMLFKHCSGNNPVTTCEISTCVVHVHEILQANHYEFNPLPPGLQQVKVSNARRVCFTKYNILLNSRGERRLKLFSYKFNN